MNLRLLALTALICTAVLGKEETLLVSESSAFISGAAMGAFHPILSVAGSGVLLAKIMQEVGKLSAPMHVLIHNSPPLAFEIGIKLSKLTACISLYLAHLVVMPQEMLSNIIMPDINNYPATAYSFANVAIVGWLLQELYELLLMGLSASYQFLKAIYESNREEVMAQAKSFFFGLLAFPAQYIGALNTPVMWLADLLNVMIQKIASMMPIFNETQDTTLNNLSFLLGYASTQAILLFTAAKLSQKVTKNLLPIFIINWVALASSFIKRAPFASAGESGQASI